MVQTSTALFQIARDRSFPVQWMHQFDLRGWQREKRRRRLGIHHILGTIKWETEIVHETLYCLIEIRHGNRYVVECCNHVSSSDNACQEFIGDAASTRRDIGSGLHHDSLIGRNAEKRLALADDNAVVLDQDVV